MLIDMGLEKKVIEKLEGGNPISKILAEKILKKALDEYKKGLEKIFKGVSYEEIEMMEEEEYESKYDEKVRSLQKMIIKRHDLFDIEHDEFFFKLTYFRDPFIFTIDQDGKIEVELDFNTQKIMDICKIVFNHMKE